MQLLTISTSKVYQIQHTAGSYYYCYLQWITPKWKLNANTMHCIVYTIVLEHLQLLGSFIIFLVLQELPPKVDLLHHIVKLQRQCNSTPALHFLYTKSLAVTLLHELQFEAISLLGSRSCRKLGMAISLIYTL